MAKYKSGVLVVIDPNEIVTGRNSRWDGLDLEKVEEYAISFEQHGQRQPVQVRNLTNDELGLVFGFHRHAAAIRYNERNPDKPMKLKCIVTSCNDEEALQYAVIENKHRRETNAMDDAVNQRRFREDYAWTNQRISELYQCSPSYVSQIEKLLSLPREVQLRVKGRTISVKAALDLTELSAEDQKEVLAQQPVPSTSPLFDSSNDIDAKDAYEESKEIEHSRASTNGKPQSLGTRVAEKVRDRKIDAGGKKTRNLSEVRKGLKEISESTESEQVKSLVSLLEKYIGGALKTKTMQTKMEGIFG